MRFKFKIPIGDWSGDGHSQCDTFVLKCNYPVEAVRQAYKDSCKLTRISFNHNNDFTGIKRDWKEAQRYQIAAGYQDSTITRQVEKALAEHGIQVREENEYDGEYENEDDREDVWIDGPEHFIELLMKFIKLSLLDLEYEIIDDGLPYLNGYWNADLNVQFGYGLYN